MRKIDEAQNAVDHRIADGNQRIQAAEAQRVGQCLQQAGDVEHARVPPLNSKRAVAR